MIDRHNFLLAALVASMIGGCASEGGHSCPVPAADGGCKSVAEVYAEASVHPGGGPSGKGPAPGSGRTATNLDAGVGRLYAAASAPLGSKRELAPGVALLTTPRVLRVLVTPWKDDEGDLQTGGFLYLRLDDGQWTIAP